MSVTGKSITFIAHDKIYLENVKLEQKKAFTVFLNGEPFHDVYEGQIEKYNLECERLGVVEKKIQKPRKKPSLTQALKEVSDTAHRFGRSLALIQENVAQNLLLQIQHMGGVMEDFYRRHDLSQKQLNSSIEDLMFALLPETPKENIRKKQKNEFYRSRTRTIKPRKVRCSEKKYYISGKPIFSIQRR